MSINTILLQIFSTLSIYNKSFSEGDIALKDEDDVLYNALYERSMALSDGWCEIGLALPLRNQCACPSCVRHATTKEALKFKRVNEYLLIKICQFPTHTVAGMLENARLLLWGDPVRIPNCPYRSMNETPYAYARHDAEVVGAVLPTSTRRAGLAELRAYNTTTRCGNEFFVPTDMFRN
jgi:hypothetical protein